LVGGEWVRIVIADDARDADDRIDRRAQLVTHRSEEAALRMARLLELDALLIELGVQRHDPAVCVLELFR
jgi:hypothetical protein